MFPFLNCVSSSAPAYYTRVKLVPRLLRLIFLLLLLPVLLLLGCQSKLMYFERSYDEDYRQTLHQFRGLALEYVTDQGQQVAHYIPPRNGDPSPKKIWLCFAGNGSLALDWLNFVKEWDPGFAYLMVDYPGYGDCQGKPNPNRIRESSQAAASALAKHLNQTPEQMAPKMGVLAHSIGCAAGLMAADDLNIQRIILISPFTTMTEMGKLVLGTPLCYLNLHRFDNRTHLANVVGKGAHVEIYHGTEDEVIPIAMSRELAIAHPGKVTLHEKEGQDHNLILLNISKEVGETMSRL
jgi:uncharacterized protein